MDTLIALGTLTAFLFSTVRLMIGGDIYLDSAAVIMAPITTTAVATHQGTFG